MTLLAFFFWIIFSVTVGKIARDKMNRNGVAWGFAAILISPLVAAILLFSAGKEEEKKESIRLFKGEEPIGYTEVPISKLTGRKITLDARGTDGPQLFEHLDTLPEGEDRAHFFHYVEEGHEKYGSPARID